MAWSVFNLATISECLVPEGIAASSDCQWAMGMPYRFSIEGKYDAGPVTFFVLTPQHYGRQARRARWHADVVS